MRRFLAFAVLIAFSLPAGLSIAGCGHNPNNYCVKNGHAYGVTTSQPVYAIMQPETTGLALAWGQTGNLGTPTAYNCDGGSASVGSWTYASSNLSLADVSPTGVVCAGTWNRNSPGGTTNFTICTPPTGSAVSSFSGCNSTSCGTVQMTATGGSVTTNPVNVYIHPPITAMTIPSQASCVSQGSSLPTSLLSETTVTGPNGVTLCSPTTTSCTSPAANVGTITYSAVNTAVVTINNTTNPTSTTSTTTTTTTTNPNGLATAEQPGSTVITAQNADVTSAAGYFSTCAPTSIALSVNGATTTTVTPSSPQTVAAVATDQNGTTINGLTLNFASTQPQNLSVNSTGVVSAAFPSHASVTAICQPATCNTAPINLVGVEGNGMPVTGNIVTIDSPGRVSNKIWMASSQSQYFSSVDLTTGTTGTPINLPYPPNSMVMDAGGDTLYFGSYHELMIYAISSTNALSKEVTAVPGVVLAVNPTDTGVIINDQLRQVIYFYTPSSGTATSISGIANHAQFSPDGSTAYIDGIDPATGQSTLFVYNSFSGWTSYSLSNQPTYTCALDAAGTADYPAYNPSYDPFCGPSVTVTVPSVAAFLSGNTTAARSFCANNDSTSTLQFYPPAGDTAVATNQLTATADGFHILGASTTTFSDIGLTQTAPGSSSTVQPGVPVGPCPAYSGTPLTLPTSIIATPALPVSASEIDQVVASPYANIAFVTYQGTGASGVLPYYTPGAYTQGSGFSAGSLGTIQLSTGAQAPVSGIFSPDGSVFFVGTSGDNLVHMVDTTTMTDTGTIAPNLTNSSGAAVPPQFLAVKSRSTT